MNERMTFKAINEKGVEVQYEVLLNLMKQRRNI